MNEDKPESKPKENAGKIPLKRLVSFFMRAAKETWKAVWFALILCGCFYLAGIGLYLGVVNTTAIGELLIGRTVVITVLDMPGKELYADKEEE